MRRARHITLAIWLIVAGGACGSGSGSGPGGGGGGGDCQPYKRAEGTKLEIDGYIEDIAPAAIVVVATTVIVNEQTEIKSEEETEIEFDDLLVGMCVEVEAMILPGGEIVAERIEVGNREDSRGAGAGNGTGRIMDPQ